MHYPESDLSQLGEGKCLAAPEPAEVDTFDFELNAVGFEHLVATGQAPDNSEGERREKYEKQQALNEG